MMIHDNINDSQLYKTTASHIFFVDLVTVSANQWFTGGT